MLVVLDDEIHAGHRVAKRHTSSTGAFASPDTGPLGRLVEGVPMFFAPPHRLPALPRPARISARVPVLVTTLGDDGALLDAIGDECSGLVVAAFGVGHVPERWVDRLGALAAKRPVVLASRIGAGAVHTRTYGAIGSETDLRRRGLLTSGFLNAYQARLLLLVLLGNGTADVPAAFARWIAGASGAVA